MLKLQKQLQLLLQRLQTALLILQLVDGHMDKVHQLQQRKLNLEQLFTNTQAQHLVTIQKLYQQMLAHTTLKRLLKAHQTIQVQKVNHLNLQFLKKMLLFQL